MPKPKLSPEQRDALKKEIKDLVEAGTPVPKLLVQVSEKYGLTTEAVRWYMKGLGYKGKKRRAKKGRKPKAKRKAKKAKGRRKRGRPRKQRKVVRRRKRRPGRPKGKKAAPSRLMKIARLFTPKQLRKLAIVQSLVPRYESLKKAEKALQKKVKAVARKAKKLAKKIRRMSLV